ncbi:MAG TPA: DNA/RNA nuclease SfsA [Gammaproteobacteria bacterium]|nr:DNA/RNA nuclease SfsA [Gammaproteobacteria bacterium]HBX26688.1 DNA/RNA nuclease SfsA [Gammaproteobacteria bacterium]
MINYHDALIEGRLIGRYKRFFVDIDVGGETITAHCANTGRMTGLLYEGSRVWFRRQPPGRKLEFSWELVEVHTGLACINTSRVNELLASTDLSFWIPDVMLVRREPTVGKHRFDLQLNRGDRSVYVEIKSVTFCEDEGLGLFPDAPSQRAIQHVNLLADMATNGLETHLVFVAMHTGIREVTPHRALDPAFADACLKARDSGVIMHAFGTEITPSKIQLADKIFLRLD